MKKALVYKYQDDSTGWVLGFGKEQNLEVDPDTQVIVDVNQGERPIVGTPKREQRVDAGIFGPATPDDIEAMEIWLASRFRKGSTVLIQQVNPLTVDDTTVFPVVVGSWITDSSNGSTGGEDARSRVFGAIFRWTNPQSQRPPVFTLKGYAPDPSTVKHTLDMKGEWIKKNSDGTTRWEFWKVVTSKKAPNTFRRWVLELTVPTLGAGDVCILEDLRLSRGQRGLN